MAAKKKLGELIVEENSLEKTPWRKTRRAFDISNSFIFNYISIPITASQNQFFKSILFLSNFSKLRGSPMIAKHSIWYINYRLLPNLSRLQKSIVPRFVPQTWILWNEEFPHNHLNYFTLAPHSSSFERNTLVATTHLQWQYCLLLPSNILLFIAALKRGLYKMFRAQG